MGFKWDLDGIFRSETVNDIGLLLWPLVLAGIPDFVKSDNAMKDRKGFEFFFFENRRVNMKFLVYYHRPKITQENEN